MVTLSSHSLTSFNPRTHMGCDLWVSANSLQRLKFQSTHPHGVRPRNISRYQKSRVSIHAPTWGATLIDRLQFDVLWCFNPRTHMGCDGACKRTQGKALCFNPRTHMGCDLRHSKTSKPFRSFNPRTHMGCDYLDLETYNKRIDVSIHAPTWGATQSVLRPDAIQGVSIHAPTWGATLQV